ncbi:MAG: cell division protein FtsZ, partial [Hyphomonadaceae bacterium]
VMAEMGTAMLGTGEGEGPGRALEAAHGAIANPLLDIVSMKGARGVLINITGGFDMTLYEVDAAANEIRAEVDPNANIILGSTFDEALEGRMRVSVVATGIDDDAIVGQQTVVQPARRAADASAPRRFPAAPTREEAPRQAPAVTPVDAYAEPRPRFASEAEAERAKGFNLFGWMRPGASAGAEDESEPPAEPPRRAADEAVRDPDLDDELEIPAFLRRQMNPR